MEGEKIRILLIEDNPGDARLIRELLAEGGGASFDLEHVDCLSKGLTRLAQGGVDIVLLDLTLPDSHDLDGLGKILAQTLEVPIVVLSGLSDERVTIKAVRSGAQDYLVKGKIDSNILVRALRYAIERQRLRVALGESEARYRLLADNIADVIWTADSEARITYVSPSIKRVLGYTVEETLKLKISDILTPDSTEQARRFVKWQMKTFARGVQYPPASMTLEHIRKDGSTLWAEVMLSFMQDKKGNVTGIMGATRDITERRKAEDRLRESEARYRLLTDNAVDLIWTMDIKGRVTYASPSAERLFGYSVDELMALKINELFTPSSAETVRKAMKEEMATKATGLQDSHRSLLLEHVRKDGSTVWTEVMMSFLHDEQGRLIGVQGVTRDITERRKAEEALRESEQRYRLLAENVKDVIWTIDMNLHLSYTSPSITQLTGYPHEEYVTKTLEEILTPASVEFVANLFAEELALDNSGQGDLFRARTFEAELICKDGSTVPVEMKATGIRDADGRPIGVLGVSRDITERKKAEEALKESEERFRTVFEGTSLSIALVDFDGKALSINPAFERMLGYNMEEFKEIEGSLKYLHLDDALMDAKLYIEMLKGKREHYTVDKRYIRKDGEVIWGRQNLSVVRGPEGKPKYFVAMVEDITERKHMEEVLRESEEKYRLYFENASDVIYSLDPKGTIISMSPVVEKMLGYKPEELIGTNIFESNLQTPATMEKALFNISRVLAGESGSPTEGEFIAKDGTRIFGEISGAPIFSSDGKVISVVCVGRDITERRKMEKELRLLSDAVKMSKDSIAISDLEGRIIEANEATLKMQGMDNREDLIGRPALELIVPEDHEMLTEKIAKGMAEGGPIYVEYRCVTKDGRKLLVEANVSVMRDRNGEPIGYMAVVRDITERKRMEEALRESEQSYRDLFGSTLDGLIVLDAETMKLVIANKTAAIIGGVDSPDDLIGLNAYDMLPSDESDRARRLVEKEVLEKDMHNIHEYQIVNTKGKKKWVSVVSTRTEFKGRLAALVSIRDVTEQKRAEEEVRLLSDAVRMSSESMFIASMEGKVVDANEAAVKMFGAMHKPELIGKGVLELISPEDHEKVIENIKKAIEEGQVNLEEYHAVKKDGSIILLEVSASALKGADEKPTGFLVMARDITERKRMEEALKQSEQSYRVLLESTHDSIIVVDAETFKITFGNRRASMMFGFDPVLQDGIGANLLDFIHPEDREIAIKGFMEDLYQAERRRRYEVRAKTQDGREIWVSALGTRIEFQGRIAVLLSLRDVTKDKQMEEEKRKLEEQIQLTGRLAAVGELAAGVAHELNNPITAIKGYAQLLTKKKELDEPLRKDLETIYRESQRAARITQNLLSFARKHEPEKHLISINEAIEKTLELRAHPMKVNNIEVIAELAPDLPKTLADFHQMQQVFVNIVNNAEQAMVDAHGQGRLVVKTRKAGNMIQISFADNGPGIPEENINRIFDPFFTTKEVGKGTGLGLSICYGLVEAHGGRIYAQSKLGQGSNFVVEIPIVTENQLVAEAALLKSGSRGLTWKKTKGQY